MRMGTFIDLANQRFGRLVAIARLEDHRWLCQCDCGNQTIVKIGNLRNGNTQSCGCLRYERLRASRITHDAHGDPLYSTWMHIRERCLSPKSKRYADYGGRGITLCDEWKADFLVFRDYISALPHCQEDGYTVDRIDNNLGYFPGNVRFATRQEQMNNTRHNVVLTHNGKTQSITAWSKETGIKVETLFYRERKKWSPEAILTTPVKVYKVKPEEKA